MKQNTIIYFKQYLLEAGATNEYGTCNAERSEYTFKGIRADLLFRDFKPNTKYNVFIKNISTANGENGTEAKDRNVIVRMDVKNINFLGNYSIDYKRTLPQSIDITSFEFPENGAQVYQFEFYCIGTIETTNRPDLEFTFSYRRVVDGALAEGEFQITNIVLEFVEIC